MEGRRAINDIDRNLRDIRICYNYIRLGISIILLAFVLAAINGLLDEPVRYMQLIGVPLTFVGLGTLLFGVGKNLHLPHLNVLRMGGMIENEDGIEEGDPNGG